VATVALAKRLVPEFAPLPDVDVEPWLEDAAAYLGASVSKFGNRSAHALAYLAGHLYLQTLGGSGGSSSAPGPASSVKDRAWSVGFAPAPGGSASATSGDLSETIPGRRYLDLRRGAGLGVGRVLS